MAATPTDVFKESNKALNVLSEIRDNMLKILQGVSDATGNSLRAEPDLVMLQKARQSLAEMLDRLKASAAWIERNQNALENIKIPKGVDATEDLKDALDKQAALRKESSELSDQIKRLLSQSYTLQFQIDALLAACHDQSVEKTAT